MECTQCAVHDRHPAHCYAHSFIGLKCQEYKKSTFLCKVNDLNVVISCLTMNIYPVRYLAMSNLSLLLNIDKL